MLQDPDQAQRRDDDEPGEHDRTEQAGYARGSLRLEREQQREDAHGDRDDEWRNPVRRSLEPLDRAQHRDRGRDHSVAIEQAGAEHTERDLRGSAPRASSSPWIEQREQRQDPALAVVVRPHDQQQVLERNDQDQRPEDQREHPEHVVRRRFKSRQRLAERIERTRPDVTVDDAKRSESQCSLSLAALGPVRPVVRVVRIHRLLSRAQRQGPDPCPPGPRRLQVAVTEARGRSSRPRRSARSASKPLA
jgi:hypothetical protein